MLVSLSKTQTVQSAIDEIINNFTSLKKTRLYDNIDYENILISINYRDKVRVITKSIFKFKDVTNQIKY